MKRIISLVITVTMILTLVPFSAFNVSAETYTDSQGVTYTLSNDGTCYVVTNCYLYVTSITIPAEINGVPVKEIGASAFEVFYSLTSIVIPNSVTTIGNDAFHHCESLTSIAIPDSVTTIGDSAFYNCTSLTSIEIPALVTSIGENPFSDCSSLEEIIVDNENKNYYSENNCLIEKSTNKLISGCKNSVIPNSVTTIGDSAFRGCQSLTSIVIPNSVTTIGSYAFDYCTSLISIAIPNSVTTIGSHAFDYCTSLTSVVIPNSVTTIGYRAFSNCESLTSVVIPDSVTTIGEDAFYNCTSLTSVVIPSSVTTIGYNAFGDCYRLISIVIPDSVTTIGDRAFSYCYRLTDIYCEAETQPAGWDSYWIYGCNATVHWGYSDGKTEEVIFEIDDNLDIEIEDNNAFEPGTVVTVVESIVEEVKETIKESLYTKVTIGNYNGTISNLLFGGDVKNQIFDFTAEKDGENVQPNAPIIINIPFPQGYSDKVSVKYLSPNGNLEDVEHTVDENNRTIKATINHFSYYVLIDEGDLNFNLGDINDNGKIDMTDYILLKRAYFGTYNFTETQKKVGDINGNQKIDMTDYILVKRMYFGTYKVK